MGGEETKGRSCGKANCLSVGSDLEDIFICNLFFILTKGPKLGEQGLVAGEKDSQAVLREVPRFL